MIPNNCTDQTQAAAEAAGAKIISCSYPVRCKGDVLHQAVDQLLYGAVHYDGFLVFDADNVVDKQFLARINDAFCSGALLAKGRHLAKNPTDSWVAGCYGLYFSTFHLIFNRARANCGLSAKLVGTGFAVHRQVFEQLGGWNTKTLAEDAEFSAQCAKLGHRVFWVPDAVTYDEEPDSFSLSLRQRRRWCSGIMDVARAELPLSLVRLAAGAKPAHHRQHGKSHLSLCTSALCSPSPCNPIVHEPCLSADAVGRFSGLDLCGHRGPGLYRLTGRAAHPQSHLVLSLVHGELASTSGCLPISQDHRLEANFPQPRACSQARCVFQIGAWSLPSIRCVYEFGTLPYTFKKSRPYGPALFLSIPAGLEWRFS